MKDEKEFVELQINPDAFGNYDTQDNNYRDFIALEEASLGLCWGLKALDICIKKATSKKVVVDVKLLGKKIARLTLTRKKSCGKVKESIDGPFDTKLASVKVEICANFDRKDLKVKGRVCGATLCVKFNQRILKW